MRMGLLGIGILFDGKWLSLVPSGVDLLAGKESTISSNLHACLSQAETRF